MSSSGVDSGILSLFEDACMQHLLIADRRPPGPHVFQVTDPSRGEPFAEVSAAGPREVEEAIAEARAAFPAWSALPAPARG